MPRSTYGTVRRLPSGRYQARVRSRGRQDSLGSFPTRREARQAIASFASDSQRLRSRRPARVPRLEAYSESWTATRSGQRYSTRARDRIVLNHDILPVFGHLRVDEISSLDIQDWIGELSTRLAPSTVRRVYAVLVSLMRSAVEAGLITDSPTERVRVPKAELPEVRFLTPDELEAVVDAIAGRFRAMVLVMAWATLRIGEACGLQRAEVDLEAGTLRVARSVTEVSGRLVEGPPKTRAGRRTMSLPASVVSELAEHLDRFGGDPWVFGGPSGRPLRASEWRTRAWYPALEKSGVARLHPHCLKHSGVAYLIAAGVDPLEVARRAGHASVSFTLERYGHLLPEVDKDAATKLNALRRRALQLL